MGRRKDNEQALLPFLVTCRPNPAVLTSFAHSPRRPIAAAPHADVVRLRGRQAPHHLAARGKRGAGGAIPGDGDVTEPDAS